MLKIYVADFDIDRCTCTDTRCNQEIHDCPYVLEDGTYTDSNTAFALENCVQLT